VISSFHIKNICLIPDQQVSQANPCDFDLPQRNIPGFWVPPRPSDRLVFGLLMKNTLFFTEIFNHFLQPFIQ
jgi:hypothetical protein